MNSSEKWDKNVSGLKSKIQFEVRKANCKEFKQATKIAMRIEVALEGVSLDQSSNKVLIADAEPMQIDNSKFHRSTRSKKRLLDIRNKACFKCHKAGCRPWKLRFNDHRHVTVSNIEASLTNENAVDDFIPGSSEN